MRTSREVSQSTKNKISIAVKKAHAKKTEAERMNTRKLQSASAKRYWSTIPKKEDDEPELDYASPW